MRGGGVRLANPQTFDELKGFLLSKGGLRMSHVYKPVMLLAIIRGGGKATKHQIASEFIKRDSGQLDYYQKKIVHQMPGKRLVGNGLLEKQGDTYSLKGVFSQLTEAQMSEVDDILEHRISDYLTTRNPFGDSHNDAVPGSVRYEVLKRSGSHCELCGASSKDTQIDVDHIIPRKKGGSNDVSNLQALCRTCNAQKKHLDDTDFQLVHESYSYREDECIFCHVPEDRKIEDSNELAYVIRDGFAVTKHHTLIIPKRHVATYFDLWQAEINCINLLLKSEKQAIEKLDPTITGFNIGINSGASAGQTVFHCHIHLIPRRDNDVENPRGGVRHIIPDKGNY